MPKEEVGEIFTIVEQPAQFPGGINEFYRFLSYNIQYPYSALINGIEGRVFVQFIIEKDGTPSEIYAIKGIGAGCDEEAVRVLKMMPKWNPGMQRGRPVRQKMIQNILFKLPEEIGPTYPGGVVAFSKFIKENLNYPEEAKNNQIDGRVLVEFNVNLDGGLSDFKFLESLGYGCDEEALRVLKMMPKWNPGIQNGEPIKQKMIQNIPFILDKTEITSEDGVSKINESAEFPGGIEAYNQYLKETVVYPKKAKRQGIEGRVFVQFTIEKDGSITNVQAIKGIGAGCDEEAVRVISEMPNWVPAKLNGEPVSQKIIQNILFVFSKNQEGK